MGALCRQVLCRRTAGHATRNVKKSSSAVSCENFPSAENGKVTNFHCDESSGDNIRVVPTPSSPSPSSTFSAQAQGSVILSSQNAALAVRRYWNSSSNMLENGFCDHIFIPELLVLHQGMINHAVSEMGVHPSLIFDEDDAGGSNPKFGEFIYCLRQQRRQLSENMRKAYDRDWGIGFHGQLSGSSCGQCRGAEVGLCACLPGGFYTDVVLQNECEEVVEASLQEEASLLMSTVSVPYLHGTVVGMRVLHLFIVDLLGRHSAAASVFGVKSLQK